MATIGTQIFNNIRDNLKGEEQKRFIETWEVVNYVDSPTKWHVAWKCKPLEKEFTLLQSPEGGGVMKNSHLHQDFSYFNTEAFIRISKEYEKKIMGYDSDLLKQFISYLPIQDDLGKGTFLTQMMCGNIMNKIIYPGYFDGYHGRWTGVERYVYMFLSGFDTDNSKNIRIFKGGNEKSFWEDPETYTCKTFTSSSNYKTEYMLGLVYSNII
jgi:hypothetical protein